MQAMTEPQPFVFDAVPVDAYMAVGAAVRKEWGDYGYSISIPRFSAGGGSYRFGVRHSDGSEFYLGADRYGNVWREEWDGNAFQRGANV